MIQKELSPEQIEHLFEFVRKKKVEYIDCQYELVDHLASAIEEEIDINPSLTFENALNNIYKRFGKLKFYKFVREKEKGLQKYWERKTWDFIKRFFVLPRILLTFVLLILIHHLLYSYEEGARIGAFLYLPVLILCMYNWLKSFLSKKGRYILVVKMFDSATWITGFCMMGLSTSLEEMFPSFQHSFFSLINAAIIVLSILWMYGMLTTFPKMIQEELEQKYAHIDYQKIFAK